MFSGRGAQPLTIAICTAMYKMHVCQSVNPLWTAGWEKILQRTARDFKCSQSHYATIHIYGIRSSRSSNYVYQMPEEGRLNIQECIGIAYSDK
jgi:hypothetical protein